jgi:hypothetical protein
MRRRIRTATQAVVPAVVAITVLAARSWACVPMANMEVTPQRAQAGQEVVVSGIRFVSFEPVVIRMNSLDGPILATVQMGPSANTLFKTSVTIPPGTPPGPVVLIATQDPTPGYVAVAWGIPARIVVTITGADGATEPSPPAHVLDRPAGLARATAGAGAVILVALGVAAGALLVAGAAALLVSRKTDQGVPPPELAR